MVGYNLGLKSDGTYSSSLGIQKLRQYAKGFGFGDKSGIELTESPPKISDTASVPSALGQGTNNSTTSQLAKYVQTVSNSGKQYDLTLLASVKDPKGKTIKKNKAEAKNALKDVDDSTGEAVHKGMGRVVDETSPFMALKEKNFKMAGKTGTAQQSSVHPDHGLFVGFAPLEDTEIAMAIRISNGYSSTYCAGLGCEFAQYYFKLTDKKALINGMADNISAPSRSD